MPGTNLANALVSHSFHPDIPKDQRIFEPLIGSWSLVVRWFDEAGNLTRKEAGEWHFAPVLEGRGVQDVWIVPPRGKRGSDDYEYGTSIRFYDATIGGWRSTWIGPIRGAVVTFIARKTGDRIVLETTPDMPIARRWVFCDITESDFRWINEEQGDRGWRVVQTFEARRVQQAWGSDQPKR